MASLRHLSGPDTPAGARDSAAAQRPQASSHPFVCPDCPGGPGLDYRATALDGTGAYVCGSCDRWFAREHWVSDFSAGDLEDPERRRSFHERFGRELELPAETETGAAPVNIQREFFDAEAEKYEAYLQRSSFWRAHDTLITQSWIDSLPAGTDLIDVGAGTGRCFLPIVEHLAPGPMLVALDISFEVMRVTADRLLERGLAEHTHLAVSDCRTLGFIRPASFDAAFLYDLLHHLDPGERQPVFGELDRLLRPDAGLYLRDNNATPLRAAFDFMMGFWQLWEAEHEGHPVVPIGDIGKWATEAGFDLPELRSSVFLPPHAFDMLPLPWALRLLRLTEWIGSRAPGMARNGGLIVAHGRRGAWQ